MAKKSYSEGATLKDKQHFQKYLAEDEELVLATGYGKNYMRHRFVFYLIFPGIIFMFFGLAYQYFKYKDLADLSNQLGYGLLVGFLIAGIIALLKTVWLYHSHRYLLTTRRVIIKNGFFAVKLTTALFDKITHIEVDQSLVDRLIMKHGSILINTAGGNKDELKLKYVDYPIEFKNLLERLINRERESYGRGTGPVVTIEGELVE